MKNLDYIFIDLDGPILDGKLKHYNCYKDIIKDKGMPLDIDDYWIMKRNKISRKILLEKSQYIGLYDEFFTQWLENIEEKKYLGYDCLKPVVKETLLSWKNNNTDKIVLVTMRNNRDSLMWQLNKLEIINLFDDVISCKSENNEKYEYVKHLKFRNAVFIGDTEEDIKTAKKLNIQSIGILNGLREKKYLESDFYAYDIKDIIFDNFY